MDTAKQTYQRGSIIAALSAPMPGAATFQCAPSVAPWEPTPRAQTEPVKLPEPRVSKRTFAEQVGMSVRWVEQKIAAGMPCEYIDGRPRLRVTEGEDWLRTNGHLAAERPKTPRPGTKGRP